MLLAMLNSLKILESELKQLLPWDNKICPFEELTPLDAGIIILGQSSDHTILDVTNCNSKIRVGSILKFKTTYLANLMLGTSTYFVINFNIGKAIKDSGVPRSQIFITSKIWNANHKYNAVLQEVNNIL